MIAPFRVQWQQFAVVQLSLFIAAVLGCELVLAQGEIDVVRTNIEQRSTDQLERHDAEFLDGSHWHLDAEEWERVEILKAEFRQYVSDQQISPLEVLGIHARTDAERQRYARRWAQLMIEDAERVLAFQRAYDVAVRDLVEEQPLIDLAHLPVRASTLPTLVPTDRLAVFVAVDCAICDEVLERVFRAGRALSGVDVYVVGLPDGDDGALHRWAQRQGIPPMAVRSKRITLNFDDGLLKRVHPRAERVPVVMRRRSDRLEPLDPWDLP